MVARARADRSPLLPEWPQATTAALEEITGAGGVVLLLGATDTGKSTLACELVNRALVAGKRVGVVDADVGQSEIGPPTTIGFGVASAPVRVVADIPPSALYFVGDTSPARHLLPTVLGTALLVRAAREGACDLVIVDTTGMVSGQLAEVLKFHKIQAVCPDTLLAVEEGEELVPLLAPFSRSGGPRIIRLPVAAGVRSKSAAYRRERRRRALAAYFNGARQLALDRDAVALLPQPRPAERSALRQRVCGLLDARGTTLAIGILQDVGAYTLRVITPWADPNRVASIQVGSLRLSPQGEELARG